MSDMKSSRKALIISLVIIVVVVIVAGFYFSAQNNSQQTTPHSTPTETNPGLQTYVWSDQGVSFQYPAMWRLEEGQTSETGDLGDASSYYVSKVSLFPPTKDSHDAITLGGRMEGGCPDTAAEGSTQCVNLGKTNSAIIYTESTNPEVLKVFDDIVGQLN